MEQANPIARLFSSTKSLMVLVVVIGAFAALLMGRVQWDQVKDLLIVVVPTWLGAHAVSDAAHSIAAPKMEAVRRSMAPPADPNAPKPPDVPKAPSVPVTLGALMVLALVACGGAKLGPAEEAEIAADQALVRAKIERCENVGRSIGRDGGLAAYRGCLADAGLSLDGGIQ